MNGTNKQSINQTLRTLSTYKFIYGIWDCTTHLYAFSNYSKPSEIMMKYMSYKHTNKHIFNKTFKKQLPDDHATTSSNDNECIVND